MSSGEILSSPAKRKIFDLINANIIKVYLNCEDTEEEDCDIIVSRPECSCGGGTAPQDSEDMPGNHEEDRDTITDTSTSRGGKSGVKVGVVKWSVAAVEPSLRGTHT